MKTIINKFLLLVTLFAGAASLHGCSDPDGIIEDIAYGREFSPLNFTHTLSNNVNVTFSWTVMAGIADYTLTLSYADGEGADWKTNPYAVDYEERPVTAADTLTVSMASGGGCAVRFAAPEKTPIR